jgi:hypothetical protein
MDDVTILTLFSILHNTTKAIPFPTKGVPRGGQLYNVGNGMRGTAKSLRLHPSQRLTCPRATIINDLPFVYRGFYTLPPETETHMDPIMRPNEFNQRTLYCAWLETEPQFIVLCEREKKEEICYDLLTSRFMCNEEEGDGEAESKATQEHTPEEAL